MDNGNCACCGDALHTKIRVEIHPIKAFEKDGSPIRGIRRSVNICGDCTAEDVAMEIAKAQGVKGAPEDKTAKPAKK